MKEYNALTYDDVQLIPSYSEIESRQDIDLTTQVTKNYSLKIPLVASPMDTVCELEMAITMANLGGVGCIHRFMTINHQATIINQLVSHLNSKEFRSIHPTWPDSGTVPVMAAIGANGDYFERSQELVSSGANVLLIDVAHGHHIFVKRALEKLKSELPSYVDVIAGNIATRQGGIDLQWWGADALRVGIGGGSLCTTRIKTGFGVPNVTSIKEVTDAVSIPVIACGGIRNSGDIAKALAFGANSVILGSLLAGTEEAPGKVIERSDGALFKRYRGAASLETKSIHNQAQRNVEGESTVIPFKGKTKFIVEGLLDGLRSAFSYAGASYLPEFYPDWCVVTNAGIAEAKPHLL